MHSDVAILSANCEKYFKANLESSKVEADMKDYIAVNLAAN
jgi:hypothetical protein